MPYADGTFTTPRQIGRSQRSFPFDYLANGYARITARSYRQIGANYVSPATPARTAFTNFILQSETFGTTWTTSQTTVSSNNAANPDTGAMTADTLLEAATTAEHYLRQSSVNFTAVPTTFSVFVKPAGRTFIRLLMNAPINGRSAVFNLTTLQATLVGAQCTTQIADAGNGWVRCSLSWTSPDAGSGLVQINLLLDAVTPSYAGNASLGAILWGAQFETASSVGPYIATTSANVSVSAPTTDQLDGNINPDPLAFLCTETPPAEAALVLGLCEFTRQYARIPATQVEYTSRFVMRPVMDDINYASTYWAVTFDDGVSSSIFSARHGISAIGTIPNTTTSVTGSVATTGTQPFSLAAISPDTWSVSALVVIRGPSGQNQFFASTNAAAIKAACESGTGLTVSVVKTNTAINIDVLTGALAWVECSDTTVSLEGGTSSIIITRLQTSARTEGTQTVSQTAASSINQNTVAPVSVRTFTTGSSHGGSPGDQVVFWKGDRIVAKSTAYAASGSLVSVPLEDVPGANFAADYIGFAPQAFLRYVNGVKNCSIKRSTYFYLPGFTPNIATGADIPTFQVYTDPQSWLTAIILSANYAAVEVSQVSYWLGPILQQQVDEVQMADALDDIDP